MVSNRATTSGQITDHILPSNHRATPAITRITSNCREIRAEVLSADRVFVELNDAGMAPP
ncbi:hypothetical protein GCM10020358_29110 [Amorphoplanes nipponensis]